MFKSQGMKSLTLTAHAIARPIPNARAQISYSSCRTSFIDRYSPVLPDVGSITTLLPGISFPSCSATSIIRFAIRSFTEPPADVYSSLPTIHDDWSISCLRLVTGEKHTKIALQAFELGYLIETEKRGLPHRLESVVDDARPRRHLRWFEWVSFLLQCLNCEEEVVRM